MQPKTEIKFDPQSFQRLKRTIRNMSVGKNSLIKDPYFAMELPDEIGIQLTNKCNLRCRHCFQWNKEGFFNKYEKSEHDREIDHGIIKKILGETSGIKSNLYLWGGEPLCYSGLEEMSDMLEKDRRWTVFCTNGIDIEKKLDAIVKISSNLAMLISVEGFEDENDSVRGRGTYGKVMKNIALLMELKRKGIFRGEVSVNCTISEKMAGKLFDFAVMFEGIGINTLYFCFPWYISGEMSRKMDDFFKSNFSWLRALDDEKSASWHSYSYRLDPGVMERLLDDIEKINSRVWKIRMRYQPALETAEMRNFIIGKETPAQKRTRCIGITNRMNVMPDGKVTVCKLFPEFEIGDLNRQSVFEIWNSPGFRRARGIISRGLMPVCSKCVLLYLHGV